jgi:hypothetical protein
MFAISGAIISLFFEKKIAFLEKNLLTEKEIKSAKIAADKWTNKYMN